MSGEMLDHMHDTHTANVAVVVTIEEILTIAIVLR